MRGKAILVADDDSSIRELVRTRLQMSGYEVVTARTGAEAVSRVRTFVVDGLILDINMPEVDGFGVLRAIQKTPSIRRLPVDADCAPRTGRRSARGDAGRAQLPHQAVLRTAVDRARRAVAQAAL